MKIHLPVIVHGTMCRNVLCALERPLTRACLFLISRPSEPTFKRSHKAGIVDGQFFELTIVHARHT